MTPKLVNSLGFKCKIDKFVYKSYSILIHICIQASRVVVFLGKKVLSHCKEK